MAFFVLKFLEILKRCRFDQSSAIEFNLEDHALSNGLFISIKIKIDMLKLMTLYPTS